MEYPNKSHNKTLQRTSGHRGFLKFSLAAKITGYSKFSAVNLRLPLSCNVHKALRFATHLVNARANGEPVPSDWYPMPLRAL